MRFERIPPYFYIALLLGLVILFLLLADHMELRDERTKKARIYHGVSASVLFEG